MEYPTGNLLMGIKYPEDLRKLSEKELEQVCKELRDFIIDVVSVNGGHFGASLGNFAAVAASTIGFTKNEPADQVS